MRTISIVVASLLLAACGPSASPTVSGVCQALAPAMPVQYHGKSDTPDTIDRIKAANARYASICS